MSPFRSILSVALVLGLVLGATPAEARFGKRARPNDSSQGNDSGKDEHEASAIGDDDDDRDDDRDDRPRRRRRSNVSHASDDAEHVVNSIAFFAFLFGGGNHRLSLTEPGYRGELRQERHAAPLSFRVGFQAGPINEGGAGDLFLGLEGRRIGLDLRATGIAVDADDGSDDTDDITLLEAHLTWAFVSLERVRVRAEAGVSTAKAPDVSFVGMSLGVSMEACLVGPLDFEARAQVTPFPYRQVDSSAALALHLGAVVLRGGYRGLLLDDAGQSGDGIVHRDSFHGPFVGLGLTY
ncbi:hypothetical protein LZ198_40555 [Myxococcus sp. K15C18031901]|uniref:hypothetical protein n=1 Tax=Myxococcus dinghuensis TaxID=2906761 RepID=UPI0020A6EC12|nr:hypothetical protein [Myxococcus dinghuensis]MCP3105179.1 hypothetical protein [Myxococcus dinghuensis]